MGLFVSVQLHEPMLVKLVCLLLNVASAVCRLRLLTPNRGDNSLCIMKSGESS